MTTSSEVFSKRKAGHLDEAYRMALELMQSQQPDEWDRKAFGWCLIDLIKREVRSGNLDYVEHYRQQLDSLTLDESDEIISNQRQYALSLCSEDGQLAFQAKNLSKEGRHAEASRIYRQLCANGESGEAVHLSFSWELYRLSKELLGQEHINYQNIRSNLNEYLKLNSARPSLVHSCFLQVASKLAGEEKLDMLAFSKLWGFENLREEDFEAFTTDDGKLIPSLAERAVSQASKKAVSLESPIDGEYVLPFLEELQNRFPEGIWLHLNLAKVLLLLGKNQEALKYALKVAKIKGSEYWVWELLGDISASFDATASIGCYCKALSLSGDEKFVGKVRIKLAVALEKAGLFENAKCEIDKVLEYRQREEVKIPDVLTRFTQSDWYQVAEAVESNVKFYQDNIPAADNLIYSQMPWKKGCLGEKYEIPGHEGKPKRRIYVQTSSDPVEASIPESIYDLADISVGDAVSVRGELDERKNFRIYQIQARADNEKWDVFKSRVGVVDHVNHTKKLLHYIVDKNVDGVVPLAELSDSFSEGDSILVKISQYKSKQGQRYRTIDARRTTEPPCEALRKGFSESVREQDGMGFTPSEIFIPPPLMKRHQVSDGQVIEGVAVLNHDKKKNRWGWKAVTISK